MINTFFFVSFVALVLGSLPFWKTAIARVREDQFMLEPREHVASPFGLLDLGIMVLTWFIGQVGSQTLAVLLLDIDFETGGEMDATQLAWLVLIAGAGQLLMTGVGMLIIWFRYRRWDIFGVESKYLAKDIGLGLVTFMMVIPAILLLQNWLTKLRPYQQPTLEILTENRSLLTLLCTWFSAVIVAPITEEIFFRGILQSWLQRLGQAGGALAEQTIGGGWYKFETSTKPTAGLGNSTDSQNDASKTSSVNPFQAPKYPRPITITDPLKAPLEVVKPGVAWWPIFACAALFGLAHIGQGLAPIPLFFFGLALGYLYRQTGSVLTCIVLHMALNGFSMFWFTLGMVSPDTPAP